MRLVGDKEYVVGNDRCAVNGVADVDLGDWIVLLHRQIENAHMTIFVADGDVIVDNQRGIVKKGLPRKTLAGPLVWLRDETDESPKNSRYFGFKDGAIMAATLEIPFAPPGKATDPASCRSYGRVMLQAWNNTHFRTPDA